MNNATIFPKTFAVIKDRVNSINIPDESPNKYPILNNKGYEMNSKVNLTAQPRLKIIAVVYWKIQADIDTLSRDYIIEEISRQKSIKEVIPHYSTPEQLTLTLKTKSVCSKAETKDFLTKFLSNCGAKNISINRIEAE